MIAGSNPFGCPYGVWWIMRSTAANAVLLAVAKIGSERMQWAKPLYISPAYNDDRAWLLDGKPVTISKILELGFPKHA